MDLFREKPKEENLDDIFGDDRKIVDDKELDNNKKDEEQQVYKKQPEIKVYTKYKTGQPLI